MGQTELKFLGPGHMCLQFRDSATRCRMSIRSRSSKGFQWAKQGANVLLMSTPNLAEEPLEDPSRVREAFLLV